MTPFVTDSVLLAARNAQGEYIAQAVHGISKVPPSSLGIAIWAISILFSVFCTILIGLRVYARSSLVGRSLKEMGWDDYLAVAGFIPLIPSCAVAMYAVQYGLGAWDWQIPAGQMFLYQARTKELMVYYEIVYTGCSLATKLSMALMILRLSNEKRYSYTIWGSVILMVLVLVACLGVMFGNCQPFQATWNEDLGYCRWPNSQGWIVLSVFGAIALAIVDWTCAITPFFILRNLQMPSRRRRSIQLILGLGLIGSMAGIIRIPFFFYYDVEKHPNDTLYFYGHNIIWTIIEAGLGVIACSLPPLRALFARFYRGSSGESGNVASASGRLGGSAHVSALSRSQKADQRSRGSNWDRLDDDDASTEGIMRLTEIHVETSKVKLDSPRTMSRASQI